MKIRNGFVSNSSSSSFIIFVKDLSLIDEINEGVGPDTGWFNDTLAEETTHFYTEYNEPLNVPEEFLSPTIKAFEVTLEQNNDKRWNLAIKDPRVLHYEFVGSC